MNGKKKLVQYFRLPPMHVKGEMLVLEVLDYKTHDRAPLGLGKFKPGAANQMWAFIPCGGGFYEIINKHSCRVLDDSESSRYPGCLVYQHGRHGGDNQQWKVKRANGDNLVQIFPKLNPNFVLDVGEHSTDRFAHMVLWHDWKGPNQIWRLIPA